MKYKLTEGKNRSTKLDKLPSRPIHPPSGQKEKFEEVVEDFIVHNYSVEADAIYLYLERTKQWVEDIIEDYIQNPNKPTKVKISAKKGKIVIEKAVK